MNRNYLTTPFKTIKHTVFNHSLPKPVRISELRRNTPPQSYLNYPTPTPVENPLPSNENPLPSNENPLPSTLNPLPSNESPPQLKQENGNSKEKEMIPVVIGLTTIPERIRKGKVQEAILSIINNSVKPLKIILTIPSQTLKGESYPLDIIENDPLFKFPLIDIYRVEEDEGPILKINGMLNWLKKDENEMFRNHTHFMLMDDDVIYPPNILRQLWNQHKLYPNASLGFAGRNWIQNGQYLYFLRNQYPNHNHISVNLLETFNLVIHPLNIFLNNFENWKQLIQKCKTTCPDSIFTDDIVISLWCKKMGVPRFIIKGPKVEINHHGTPTLSSVNLKGRNNLVYKKIWNL